jgi:hypothetical protein
MKEYRIEFPTQFIQIARYVNVTIINPAALPPPMDIFSIIKLFYWCRLDTTNDEGQLCARRHWMRNAGELIVEAARQDGFSHETVARHIELSMAEFQRPLTPQEREEILRSGGELSRYRKMLGARLGIRPFPPQASSATDGATRISESGTTVPTSEGQARPLTGTYQQAAAIIDAEPGLAGKQIADRLQITDAHFRRSIVPKLKDRGYYNDDGYRPPVVWGEKRAHTTPNTNGESPAKILPSQSRERSIFDDHRNGIPCNCRKSPDVGRSGPHGGQIARCRVSLDQ